MFYFAYAGHNIPPKRIEFGKIQKNPPGPNGTGGGTRISITGKTPEEKAVWQTLGEGNEDCVEWVVLCAALNLLEYDFTAFAKMDILADTAFTATKSSRQLKRTLLQRLPLLELLSRCRTTGRLPRAVLLRVLRLDKGHPHHKVANAHLRLAKGPCQETVPLPQAVSRTVLPLDLAAVHSLLVKDHPLQEVMDLLNKASPHKEGLGHLHKVDALECLPAHRLLEACRRMASVVLVHLPAITLPKVCQRLTQLVDLSGGSSLLFVLSAFLSFPFLVVYGLSAPLFIDLILRPSYPNRCIPILAPSFPYFTPSSLKVVQGLRSVYVDLARGLSSFGSQMWE